MVCFRRRKILSSQTTKKPHASKKLQRVRIDPKQQVHQGDVEELAENQPGAVPHAEEGEEVRDHLEEGLAG